MSAFKSLLGAFVQFDETEVVPPTVTPASGLASMPTTTKSYPTISSNTSDTYQPTSNQSGVVDEKFAAYFEDELNKANIPGIDFFEFMKVWQGMSSIGLPEDKLYQASWEAYKASGGQQQKSYLTDTAQKYIDTLNADKTGFMAEIDRQINSNVGDMKSKMTQLQTDNDNIQTQINNLSRKQTENSNSVADLSSKISTEASRLNTSKANYEATLAQFINGIKKHVQSINTYIK